MARHIILSVLVGDPEFVLTLDDPLPKPLLRAIRILVVADVTNGVKRNFDVPLKKQETRVLAVLRELVQSVRCPETPVKEDEDAADDDLPVEDLEFERFCKIYRDGIDQILNAAEAKIADMEKAITD